MLIRQRVLADPAESGVARERFLQHRRRIDEGAIAERADFVGDAVGQFLQAAAHHLVVVAAERVTRDVARASDRRARPTRSRVAGGS